MQVHLPQPVLGVAEALAEPEVLLALGANVGHPPCVAADLDGAGDALDRQLTAGLGQGAAEQLVPEGADRGGRCAQHSPEDRDPSHAY